MPNCPNCGAVVQKNDAFCGMCAFQLPQAPADADISAEPVLTHCPNCGAEIHEKDTICSVCAFQLPITPKNNPVKEKKSEADSLNMLSMLGFILSTCTGAAITLCGFILSLIPFVSYITYFFPAIFVLGYVLAFILSFFGMTQSKNLASKALGIAGSCFSSRVLAVVAVILLCTVILPILFAIFAILCIAIFIFLNIIMTVISFIPLLCILPVVFIMMIISASMGV